MQKKQLFGVVAMATALGLLSVSYAQKGIGDAEGIARQAVKPEVQTMSGEVIEIKIGPCENTTGRSSSGAHLIVQKQDGQTINLHLGPADAVEDVVEAVSVGQSLEFDAFRTEQMTADNYVAKSLTVNEQAYELRDDNLRPAWAGGYSGGPGRAWKKRSGQRRGQGPRGTGPCWW